MAHKSKRVQDKEDVSVLRTPIQLHGKTVEQILNGVHYGTPELRGLLLDECDIIFECKVCRALFRDIANFIAHKRGYCSKSATEDNHLAIAKMPDEKVYVVHPQEPQFPPTEISCKPKSKPSLEETIARIQSGELGHSHAFKVYSDAANKLQRQKEEMKIATIRTKPIPTNPNAVFVDVNMTSVNIHERSAAVSSNPSKNLTSDGASTFQRKAGERVSSRKEKGQIKNARGRILRKDCKNSEELQKLLLKELKEIQYKVKQKSKFNSSPKISSQRSSSLKVRNNKSGESMSPSTKVVETKQKTNQLTETSSHSSDPSHNVDDKEILHPPASSSKVNIVTSMDLNCNGRGNFSSDVISPGRSQTREKGIILEDQLIFGNKMSKDNLIESSEMDLIRFDRQSVGISTTRRNKHNPSVNLVSRKQSGENMSKDKESQSSELVSIVSHKQHFKSIDEKVKGGQSSNSLYSNLRQNARSATIKSESFANVIESASSGKKIDSPAPSVTNSEQNSKSRTSRSSPGSKYTLRRKELICSICHGIFSSSQSLSFHKKIKHSSLRTFYPCLYCPSVFYYFYGVTRHLKLQHSKSKSEVNFLRKQLRAKAYTKLLPEKGEDTEIMVQSKGSRKSLRSKQEAFSSQTSPDSSYVFHSVKKAGKKLSAKKDALDSSQYNENLKEFRCNNEKSKGGKNSKSDIKHEIVNPSEKLALKSSTIPQEDTKEKPKRKMMRNSSSVSPLSPKSLPSGQNRLHACKKCKRYFGRFLTYKNHIKTCQGQVTVLPHKRKGRPCKNSLVHGSRSKSTVLTRHQKMQSSRKSIERSFSKKLTSSPQSKQFTRSSGKDGLRCVNSFKQRDSESELSHSLRKKKIMGIENGRENVSTASSSNSELIDTVSDIKDGQGDLSKSKRNKESSEINDSEIKRESTLKASSLETPCTIPETIKDNADIAMTLNNADSMTKPKTRIYPQRLINLSTNVSKSTEEDEKDPKKVTPLTRNTRSIKEEATPAPEIVSEKSNLTPVIYNRERRTGSVERDLRSKISHLIPRFPVQNSASNKEVTNQDFTSSSANEARPKRKRKVPRWNMDAMEMLTKIHNRDKDVPSVKKRTINREIETDSCKLTRGRSSSNDKYGGNVIKTEMISVNDRPKEEKDQLKDKEYKEGKISKNLSRIFNLGRKKSRGRKLLRAYDNARIDKLIDVQNCKCLVCGEICTQIFNLRRHVIRIHLQWSRFQCKLCRFASFDRSECTTHIIRNHHREIDVKNTQEIESYITDLAKQSSQIMNMKKNQTLRNKSKVQNKETNIYARPNVRKMPRLAERTLSQGRRSESLSSVEKETPDKDKCAATIVKSKHSLKSETTTRDALDVQPPKNSLPFNISTRNSPRVFDIRPYKSSDKSDAQEIVVLHTRKGVYTKTVPSVPARDNSESEKNSFVHKEKKSSTSTLDDCDIGVEKALFENCDSSSKEKQISDERCLNDNFESKNEEEYVNKDEQQSDEPICDTDTVPPTNKEIGKGEVFQQNQSGDEDCRLKIKNSPIPHSSKFCHKGPTQSSVIDPSLYASKSIIKEKDTDDSDIASFMGDSDFSRANSSSINMSPTVKLVNSPKAKKLIPSYVNYKSSHLPDALSSSSSSASKVLSFVSECLNTSEDSKPFDCMPSATIMESKSKSTFIDDIDAESSSAVVLESPASQQTPPLSDHE